MLFCSQTTIGFDRSFNIKFKCHLFQKAILDLCNQMLSVSFKLLKHFSSMPAFSILPPELFYPTAQTFYDNLWVDIMLLEAGPCFFLDPLKAHLKQCRLHSRTSQHRNEPKHSSTERGMDIRQGFLRYLKPVLRVKAQDTIMRRGEMTEILLH